MAQLNISKENSTDRVKDENRLAEENQHETIIFNSRDELLRLDIDRIVFFEASGNYTNINLSNKLRFMTGMNLLQVEKIIKERLADREHLFVRVGKRYIINMRYIVMVNSLKQIAILSDYVGMTYKLEISKDAAKSLKDVIKNTGI